MPKLPMLKLPKPAVPVLALGALALFVADAESQTFRRADARYAHIIREYVARDIAEYVTGEIPEYITGEIREYVTTDVPEYVTRDVPEYVTEEIPEYGETNGVVRIVIHPQTLRRTFIPRHVD